MIRLTRQHAGRRARLFTSFALVSGIVLGSTASSSAEVPSRRAEPTDHVIRSAAGVEVRGPVRVTDPLDVPGLPWADVRSVTLDSLENGRLRVEMTTEAFSPLSHPDWIVGFTEVGWMLDTNGDKNFDWQVALYVKSNGTPVGEIYKRGAENPRCTGVVATKASAARYSVTFKPSCIGSPNRVRAFVRHAYDDTELEVETEDFAPDNVWTPWLRLSGGGGGGGGGGGTERPGAPGAPTGSGINNGVEVTWAAPADDGGGTIRSYTVQGRAQVPVTRQRPTTRIVGGSAIDISDAPWQVGLIIQNRFLCGGTVIDSRWVLTAAHCTDEAAPGEVLVFAGLADTNQWNAGVAQAVDRVIVHPGWNPDNNKNDITLLRLAEPITGATPIRLFTKTNGPSAGTPAFVSGWGNTDPNDDDSSPETLQGVSLQVLAGPSGKCGSYQGFDSLRMLCAGMPNGGKDSCQGDSGGPLVVSVGNSWELAGVVSFGIGCARAKYPGVYARVSTYVPWIYDNIGWSVTKTVDCDGPCRRTRVTGLDNGTAYVFSVSARNSAGRGPWSRLSAAIRAGA